MMEDLIMKNWIKWITGSAGVFILSLIISIVSVESQYISGGEKAWGRAMEDIGRAANGSENVHGALYFSGLHVEFDAESGPDSYTSHSGTNVLSRSFPITPISATYSVTYSGNGSTGGAPPSDSGIYNAGASVRVRGNTGNLVKGWYAFVGWNTSADGSGVAYVPTTSFVMGNADVALYAQWSLTPRAVSVWGGARECITLKSDGTVWTWGYNAYGELGDGTTTNSPVPLQVHGPGGTGRLGSITAVMGGEIHNIVLKSDGTVWAWGWNAMNMLGDGTTITRLFPVQVSGLSSIVSLGSRAYHSLAVKSDGTVWAWGWNKDGALGNGVDNSASDYPVPIQVQGVNNPIMVTAGYCFSVALLQDHTLVAWGKNNAGQLGDGTTATRLSPVTVAGLTNVISVSAGWTHVAALRADGTVWTWGSNNWTGAYPGSGKLGDGTTQDRYTPVQVPGLTGVIAVSAGDGHTAVLKEDGTVWTFGSNAAGQCGDGTYTQRLSPVQVQGLSGIVNLTARDFHNQAVQSDGTVWSWGSGTSGELGNGKTYDSPVPVKVIFATDTAALYAYFTGAGLYKYDGSAWSYLHPSNPASMAAGTNLYAYFGGSGLWKYDGSAWSYLHPGNPASMKAGTNLYAYFSGYALYKYDTAWSYLHPSNPDSMAAGTNLYAFFSGYGLWKHSSAWNYLHPSNPANMAAGTNLYAYFTGSGLWKYDGSAWSYIHSTQPTSMVAGTNLYAYFSGYGLYKHDGTAWSYLHPSNPASMAAGDNLYAFFSGYGLYKYDTAWSYLHPSNPASMMGED